MGKGYFPSNISAQSRFFFFSSLATSPVQEDQDLANEVTGILNQNELNTQDETEGETRIEMALQFLYDMYQKELQIEYQYWNEKVLNNPVIKNSKYEEAAKNCFSEGKIDYITFMNLLKLIEAELDGSDWKERLDQLQKEVKSFNDAVNLWKKDREEKEKKEKKDIKSIPQPNFIISQLFKQYDFALTRNQSTLNQVLNQTRTNVNAVLGSKRSEFYTILIKWIKTHIKELIFMSQQNISLTPDQQRAYISLIASVIAEKVINVYEQMGEEKQKLPDVLKLILKQIEDEWQQRDENNQNNTFSDQLKKQSTNLLKFLDLLQQQGEAMASKKGDRLTLDKRGIKGLTKDLRSKIEIILSETDDKKNQQSIEALQKKYKNANFSSKTVRQEYYDDLAAILKKYCRKKNMTNENIIKKINQLLDTHTNFTIYNETEFRSARGLAGIIKSNMQKILPQVIGGTGGKTDVTIIDDCGKLIFEIDDDIFDAIIKGYDEDFETEYQRERQIISEQIYEKTEFSYQQSFSLLAQTQAVSTAQKQLVDRLSEAQTELSTLSPEEHKKLLEELKNIFIIDDSVKHSDFIFDGYGFSGGSIGANVTEQVDNICDFFELGGISHADRDWLIFAVLNCGEGLMGKGMRPSLEDYFSTVASMLMFRTGGLLADQVSKNGSSYYSVNNIHILTLNGIFVPMSYVLKLTYEALQQTNATIERTASGSRAIIHNNVSENNKITGNTRIIEKNNQTIDTGIKIGRWYETYKVNYPKVSINVQLLGGFLDLLNSLQQNFSFLT